MNKKRLAAHVFCLFLFIAGCGIFWLLGLGEDAEICSNDNEIKQNVSVAGREDNICLSNQTMEVVGRRSSHNTSIKTKNGEAENCPVSPSTSNLNRCDVEERVNIETTEKREDVIVEESVKEVGFHGFGRRGDSEEGNSTEAIVYTKHKNIGVGDEVKLRLMDDIVTDEIRIYKNTTVFAKASVSGNRMFLKVESVKQKESVLPFKAVVYDADGEEGIRMTDNAGKTDESKMTLPSGYKVVIRQVK